MEAALVTVATGALKPVLKKLGALVGDKYKRFKGVRKDIKSLSNELAAMDVFLEKMSEEENPDPQDKVWMNEVRELSYDMEDCIDDFMLSVDDKDAKPDGFMEKIKHSRGKMKTRHRIGNEIHDLKKKITEVGEGNERYKTRQAFCNTKNASIDPRALAIFEHASNLVGIDEPKAEIIKLLTGEDFKVVSIVGSGGMGKTTLANQVYEEFEGQFDCCAFLSVSRNPDMMNILRIILSEVSNQPYADTKAGSIQQLIRKINVFLEDKRYFIVVDDIWNEESWDVIKCAFPTTNSGSKIITTTRMNNVAQACHSSFRGHIYVIRALNIVHSRELFHGRLFNSEVYCPSYLKEVSEEILKKCDGLPLAIIAISGLLSNIEGTEHAWNQVKDSIGHALERNSSIDGMMKILSLSYFDLPPHLKACLLYLSLFPEDSIIEKNDLIRRWIAEGFIRSDGRYTVYEIGERCFNELINRNLIQPVKFVISHQQSNKLFRMWAAEGHADTEGGYIVAQLKQHLNKHNRSFIQPLKSEKYQKVMRCQVHDTIHDFIIAKSVEQNFASFVGVPTLPVGTERKVRRLCIQVSKQENSIPLTDMVLSHTRSLHVFAFTMEIPCLDEFRYLRVLNLEGCFQVENHHLANIGRLFQLKCLNLKRTRISELPEQIRHARCLEMLDLRDTNVIKLPASIINLGKLVHLLTNSGVKFPEGISKMQALQMLKQVSIFRQTYTFLQELGQLQNLRKLVLDFQYDSATGDTREVEEECYKAIASSLHSLGRLPSLTILYGRKFLGQGHLCHMPLSLQKLMTYWSPVLQVPKWLSSLVQLKELFLRVQGVGQEDLCILGSLSALHILNITETAKSKDIRLTVNGEVGFPCLRKFCFVVFEGIGLMFEAGSMPKLEKLEIWFNAAKPESLNGNDAFDFGIKNLPFLSTVTCDIYQDYESFVQYGSIFPPDNLDIGQYGAIFPRDYLDFGLYGDNSPLPFPPLAITGKGCYGVNRRHTLVYSAHQDC